MSPSELHGVTKSSCAPEVALLPGLVSVPQLCFVILLCRDGQVDKRLAFGITLSDFSTGMEIQLPLHPIISR